jgi:hypothetical protein
VTYHTSPASRQAINFSLTEIEALTSQLGGEWRNYYGQSCRCPRCRRPLLAISLGTTKVHVPIFTCNGCGDFKGEPGRKFVHGFYKRLKGIRRKPTRRSIIEAAITDAQVLSEPAAAVARLILGRLLAGEANGRVALSNATIASIIGTSAWRVMTGLRAELKAFGLRRHGTGKTSGTGGRIANRWSLDRLPIRIGEAPKTNGATTPEMAGQQPEKRGNNPPNPLISGTSLGPATYKTPPAQEKGLSDGERGSPSTKSLASPIGRLAPALPGPAARDRDPHNSGYAEPCHEPMSDEEALAELDALASEPAPAEVVLHKAERKLPPGFRDAADEDDPEAVIYPNGQWEPCLWPETPEIRPEPTGDAWEVATQVDADGKPVLELVVIAAPEDCQPEIATRWPIARCEPHRPVYQHDIEGVPQVLKDDCVLRHMAIRLAQRQDISLAEAFEHVAWLEPGDSRDDKIAATMAAYGLDRPFVEKLIEIGVEVDAQSSGFAVAAHEEDDLAMLPPRPMSALTPSEVSCWMGRSARCATTPRSAWPP